MTDSYNLQAAVDNAVAPPSTYFGQVTFDVWACVPIKGVGLVPFDAQAHKPGQRRTAVHIVVTPLPSSNATFDTERKVLAESRDWANITMPSYKALGLNSYTELHEKWVRYEMVPTGRTYEAKDMNGQPTGETKDATTFKFLAYYNTLEEAEAAASALYGGGNGNTEPAPTDKEKARKTALPFLPVLAKQAGGDPEKMATLLASNPITKEIFDINSPEVIALLVPEPF